MSSFICCCASEDCAVHGCARMRAQQDQLIYRRFPSAPAPAPVQPLTADDVRRIVREEIKRAAQEQTKQEPTP